MVKIPSTIDTPPSTPCLSVLGTGSDVGKSIVATALCRIFSDMGLRVAPYKAQNMSNNSGVTPEGLEMGRAQIVQAEAARIPPHVDMNPILLKPTSHMDSMVGTLACLPDRDRQLIAGFIINRFRGDITLFEDGKKWIEDHTGKPVFGVLPWFSHFKIEAEDSVVIENLSTASIQTQPLPAVAVIRIPHISNFTDFDPLIDTPGLNVYFVEKAQDLSLSSAVIIPGSKNTRFDLQWLHDTGWTERIRSYARAGGHLLGICGGYQISGTVVRDPEGIEGKPGNTPGLSLLPVETILKAPKTTTLSKFRWEDDIPGAGYEIHMGQSILTGGHPLFRMTERNGAPCRDTDGCRSDNGHIIGTYMHGLFDTPAVMRKWLQMIGLPDITVSESSGNQKRDRAYDLLAEHFKVHVDMEAIAGLM